MAKLLVMVLAVVVLAAVKLLVPRHPRYRREIVGVVVGMVVVEMVVGVVMYSWQSEPEAASTGEVKTHSEKTRGSFFDTIIQRGKTWFAEED